MERITEQDLKNLKFDGIIVGVPYDIKDGQHNDIKFIAECNYYTNGEHGYKEKGHGADVSSFYQIAYNTNSLPNGLWMNATSRFTIDHVFRFDSYKYFKFKDLTEFCNWYLQQNAHVELSKPFNEPEPITKKQKYKDIMKLIDYKLLLVQLQYDLQAMEEKRHVAGYKFFKKQYVETEAEMNKFLSEKA